MFDSEKHNEKLLLKKGKKTEQNTFLSLGDKEQGILRKKLRIGELLKIKNPVMLVITGFN
jgi:hypothetical protein